jgi:hypothetical protein
MIVIKKRQQIKTLILKNLMPLLKKDHLQTGDSVHFNLFNLVRNLNLLLFLLYLEFQSILILKIKTIIQYNNLLLSVELEAL